MNLQIFYFLILYQYYYPEIEYRSDNAAMIALSGYFNVLQGKFLTKKEDILAVDRDPRLSL